MWRPVFGAHSDRPLSGARRGSGLYSEGPPRKTGQPPRRGLLLDRTSRVVVGRCERLAGDFWVRRNQTSSVFLSRSAGTAQYLIAGLPCRSCGSPSAGNQVVYAKVTPPRPVFASDWRVPRAAGRSRAIQGLTLNTSQAGKWRIFFSSTKVFPETKGDIPT
jgi:hypothetical protein